MYSKVDNKLLPSNHTPSTLSTKYHQINRKKKNWKQCIQPSRLSYRPMRCQCLPGQEKILDALERRPVKLL